VISALIAVAGLSLRNAQGLVSASAWVAHTDEVIAELERTRSTIAGNGIDDTGLRSHLDTLRELTLDNGYERAHLQQIYAIRADAQANDGEKNRRLLRMLSEMTSEEQRLLADRTSRANSASRATLRMIALFSVIAVLICVLSYWGILRNLEGREQTEQALTESELRLQSLLAREQELSRIDPLTTICNRRGFYEALERDKEPSFSLPASRYPCLRGSRQL